MIGYYVFSISDSYNNILYYSTMYDVHRKNPLVGRGES